MRLRPSGPRSGPQPPRQGVRSAASRPLTRRLRPRASTYGAATLPAVESAAVAAQVDTQRMPLEDRTPAPIARSVAEIRADLAVRFCHRVLPLSLHLARPEPRPPPRYAGARERFTGPTRGARTPRETPAGTTCQREPRRSPDTPLCGCWPLSHRPSRTPTGGRLRPGRCACPQQRGQTAPRDPLSRPSEARAKRCLDSGEASASAAAGSEERSDEPTERRAKRARPPVRRSRTRPRSGPRSVPGEARLPSPPCALHSVARRRQPPAGLGHRDHSQQDQAVSISHRRDSRALALYRVITSRERRGP